MQGTYIPEKCRGIHVHEYGAHIFHTSNHEIWEYINQYAQFNRFVNSPMAIYRGEIYNLPFNMNTFSRLWNVKTPDEARAKIEDQIVPPGERNNKSGAKRHWHWQDEIFTKS